MLRDTLTSECRESVLALAQVTRAFIATFVKEERLSAPHQKILRFNAKEISKVTKCNGRVILKFKLREMMGWSVIGSLTGEVRCFHRHEVLH